MKPIAKKLFAALWPIAFSLQFSACVSTHTPRQTAYEGVDQISDFNGEQIVGLWRVTALNPLANSGSRITLIEYKPDGTVVGNIEPSGESAKLGFGKLRLNGEWSVGNGVVVHREVKMTSESDSELGELIANIVNSSSRNLGGKADVFELSANRIVMVGSDGAAMQYDRQ